MEQCQKAQLATFRLRLIKCENETGHFTSLVGPSILSSHYVYYVHTILAVCRLKKPNTY